MPQNLFRENLPFLMPRVHLVFIESLARRAPPPWSGQRLVPGFGGRCRELARAVFR